MSCYGKGAMPIVGTELVYKEVFQMPGLKQDEIYNRAVKSLERMFPKYMHKITSQDEVHKKLTGYGKFEFVYKRSGGWIKFTYPYVVEFNVTIEARDERYRIIIDQVTLKDEETESRTNAANPSFCDAEALDKQGFVKNSNNGCKRIGIIASYLLYSHFFNQYMKEPIREPVTTKVHDDNW
ncbi:MAG: DUF4468 domain-containing protein [Bacteroidaceae bacterium]|nr:DUF4468 domain-containing protein [Bacteroidaceae bacterium]